MNNKNIRQPVVSGQFYPADPEELRSQIRKFLKEAESRDLDKDIKALMLPHAGYSFSGAVAAEAYKQIRGEKRGTVVLLCNSHSSFFEGVALSESDSWTTPLGEVEVDKDKAQKLVDSQESFIFYEDPHIREHSLEVQLPFLQTVLEPGFKIVPVLFGNISGEESKHMASALSEILQGGDLVVASSDMSHFPPYEEANRIDSRTLEIIADRDIEELENHISEVMEQGIPGEDTLLCGEDGVKTIMEMARSRDWGKGEVLRYANSGDTDLASKDSVVGYGTIVFAQGEKKDDNESQEEEQAQTTRPEQLAPEEREFLLKVARESVENYVNKGRIPEFEAPSERLQEPKGAFVTIKKGEELRGCIGQIVQSEKPLWQVAQDMAIAAATKDGRFSPVTSEELPELTYEISVLSLPFSVRDWKDIQLGEHGVIVRKGGNSGVFLPQVAEEISGGKEEFLAQLCWNKAGLPPESYKNDPELEMYAFTVDDFSTVENKD